MNATFSSQMLNLLISKGGHVSAMDKRDRRPIHWAAYMGKEFEFDSMYLLITMFQMTLIKEIKGINQKKI
jgi:ankyrin repeat protein